MKKEGDTLEKNISLMAYIFHALPIEKALPKLLEKILEQRKKALIKFDSTEELEHFNTVLWTYHPKSFLPHGTDLGNKPEKQPVLLTSSQETLKNPPNSPSIIIFFSLEELSSFLEFSSSFEKIIFISTSLSEKNKNLLNTLSKKLPLFLHIQDKDGKWIKNTPQA